MGTRRGRPLRRGVRRATVVSAVALAAVMIAAVMTAPGASAGDACSPDRIDFSSAAGEASFTIEVVDTEESRAQGLMFREDLGADSGMLFVYPDAAPRAFWMKNTPLPLDIVFLNDRGAICSVARNTTPFSLDVIPSTCSAQTILEVNAGIADEAGLKVGVVARHPAIARPLWPCEDD